MVRTDSETVRLSGWEWLKIIVALGAQVAVLVGFLLSNERRMSAVEVTQRMLTKSIDENRARILTLENNK